MKFNKTTLLVSILGIVGFVSAFGQNNIGTLVTDPIRPFSVSSTHPSAIANEIKGGPFTSSNLAGLSNIPAPRLEIGAIGYASNTGLYYRLTATNPATWSSINGSTITNLSAGNIVGNIPFSNISNSLSDTNLTLGSATFSNFAQFPMGSPNNPALRFNAAGSGIYSLVIGGAANLIGVSLNSNNIVRFQTNRVLFDQPISFSSSTGIAALTTRTNLGIQDFVTNSVVPVVSGGTGATNAGGARTNLGLGATNNATFKTVITEAFATFSNYVEVYGPIWIGDSGTSDIFQFENGTADQAKARTNLGIGATWLTNTNVTNFRTAIGLGTNAQPVFYGALITGDLFAGSLEVAFGSNSTAVTADGIEFTGSHAATTRTNLGLGWTALTNTNAGTGLVSVNINGDVVSPTNFWQRAPIQTTVQDFTGITVSQTNNATNARNVYVYSLATNVSGISNTIILPTNVSTFNGDEVCVVHKGTTNTTTVVRQAGSTNNLITLNRFDESVKFIRELGQWDFYHNISFVEPIQFSGTNASANAAASRTNLGISLAALTNTNNATFQEAIFTTNAAPTNAGNFGNHAAWIGVSIVTNGVTNTFLIPLYK